MVNDDVRLKFNYMIKIYNVNIIVQKLLKVRQKYKKKQKCQNMIHKNKKGIYRKLKLNNVISEF
jgi:hypothetical protein